MESECKVVKLKLMIDKEKKKVLFAEAGKEFVDFIFSTIALPLGSILGLLLDDTLIGSLSNLYKSISNLDNSYMLEPSTDKRKLLNPTLSYTSLPPQWNYIVHHDPPSPIRYYICSATNIKSRSRHRTRHISSSPTTSCPSCNSSMNTLVTEVESTSAYPKCTSAFKIGYGYVKSAVPFMVMDDLGVKPISTISMITMLNDHNVFTLQSLEEKEVDFGFDQAVKLLKYSLETKSVLTRLFLS